MMHEILIAAGVEDQLEEVAAYLESRWGKNSAQKLIDSFYAAIAQIARFPYLHSELESDPGVRRCVVLGKSLIYYKVMPEVVIIVAFTDGRVERPRL